MVIFQIKCLFEQSIEEEKQDELEFLAMVEAARRAEAALEEGGAVYSAGDNRRAQLGVGDLRGRESFTVVKHHLLHLENINIMISKYIRNIPIKRLRFTLNRLHRLHKLPARIIPYSTSTITANTSADNLLSMGI